MEPATTTQGTMAYDSYGLEKPKRPELKCKCNTRSDYLLRNRRVKRQTRKEREQAKKKSFCYKHDIFDIGFAENDIENRPHFKDLLISLHSYNLLYNYIKASQYFHLPFFNRRNFYQNARKLCEACSFAHQPHISVKKTSRLIACLFRWSHETQEIRKQQGRLCRAKREKLEGQKMKQDDQDELLKIRAEGKPLPLHLQYYKHELTTWKEDEKKSDSDDSIDSQDTIDELDWNSSDTNYSDPGSSEECCILSSKWK